MLNLRTGKHLNAPRCESLPISATEGVAGHILHGKQMTRGGFLKGILASGIAPSITLATLAKVGSANASVGRGMMRNVGARNAAMFGGGNAKYDAQSYVAKSALIYQLDAIENSSYGKHEAISGRRQIWNNLVDNGQTWFRHGWDGSIQFHDDYVDFEDTTVLSSYGGYAPAQNMTRSSYSGRFVVSEHIEIVFSTNDSSLDQIVLYGGLNQNGVHIKSGIIGCGNNKGYSIQSNQIVSLSFFSWSNIDDNYWLNGVKNSISQSVSSKATGGTNNYTLIGGGYQSVSPVKYYSIRFYNRQLTQDEISENFKIDKARFGIK